MIDSLRKNKGDSFANIVLLHVGGWNTTEICKILEMSRFKVKRQLFIGLSYMKKLNK